MRRLAQGLSGIFAALLFASITTPVQADSVMLNLRFESLNQSMWGPGAASPPARRVWTLIDPQTVSFNLETPDYNQLKPGFFTVDTYFWGDIDFGFGGRAKAAGHLGLFATLTVTDPGSVDVTYPVTPTLTFPDANTFRAGDTVTIGSSYNRASDWELETRSPNVSFGIDTDFSIFLDLHAKACFVACTDTTSLLGLPSPTINFGLPGSGPSSYPDGPRRFNIFTISTGDEFETPPQLGLLVPFSGKARVPQLNCSRAENPLICRSEPLDSRSLLATGLDEFLSVTLDLLGVVSILTGIPGEVFAFDTADFGSLGGVRFHYKTIGAAATAALSARQRFEFHPDLKVSFSFPEPLEYWIVPEGGSPQPHQTAATAEINVGDTIHIVTPSDKKTPMPVTPKFRLDNTFKSQTGFQASERLELSALDFGVQIPPITIVPQLCFPEICIDLLFDEVCTPEFCTPSVSIDPPDYELAGDGAMFEKTINIATQDLGNIVDGQWQLAGFQELTVNDLSIDPENPIVNISQVTGATRNIGNGKRLVPFQISITNPGDVKLSELELRSYLQVAFQDVKAWTVDEVLMCGLLLNENFDGSGDTNLLANGNELDVAATKRAIVYVVVSPSPDPNPFTSNAYTEGRSPINTLVSAEGNSSVELGPSNPTSAADFVVFGEHFVKFEASGNVGGHVGSNDFVEVKKGQSGNVAGDLRAGRTIKVQGSISADYAFSGGIVDVVGKGELTLYGNVKEFENVARFTASSPAFEPAGAFLGDIWVAAGTGQTIEPGHYGYITVDGGGALHLNPGTYHIQHLTVRTGGSVQTQAPSTIFTRDYFDLHAGSWFTGSGPSREVQIHALQTDAVEIGGNAVLRGALVAARANVRFGANSRLEGSAYGRSITLASGVSAAYHIDCDPLIDPDCDGTANCP